LSYFCDEEMMLLFILPWGIGLTRFHWMIRMMHIFFLFNYYFYIIFSDFYKKKNDAYASFRFEAYASPHNDKMPQPHLALSKSFVLAT